MYYEYFGLTQAPFKITPDTSLFFPGGNRGAVLEALVYAIVSGEGIVKVVGEVGSGKTMLCRMLQVELPDNVEIVYLANPSLKPDEILHAIAFELNLEVDNNQNRLQVMHALQEYLLAKHSENIRVVMFVEEAQGMPLETLEEIRLLSNLETRQDKLLQIVLFGQPELDENLSQQHIRQLRERITYSFDLTPFNPDQTRDYINTRLRSCGYKTMELFSPAAIKAINQYSGGLLRRVNILADKAMLAAFASNQTQVTHKHVKVAANDSEFNNSSKASLRPWLTAAAVLLLLVIAGVWFWQPQLLGQSLNLSEAAALAPQEPAVVADSPDAVATTARSEKQATNAVVMSPPVEAQVANDIPAPQAVTEQHSDQAPVQETTEVVDVVEDDNGLFNGRIVRPELETMIDSRGIEQISRIVSSP